MAARGSLIDSLPAVTARAYFRTIVGGLAIERELAAGEALLCDPDARRRHVGERLGSLLRDAAARVPFYRQLVRDGFDPGSISDPDDLARLPIVTREMMQRAPDQFAATPLPPHSTASQTGGSTGTPLTFWHDPAHRARMRVDLQRGYRWCGHRPGDRSLFLWGSDYDARAHRTVLGRALDRWGYNRQWVNAFDFGPEQVRAALDLLERWQPAFLIAYTTCAWLLGRALAAAGRRAALRAVEVTAETLTPSLRDDLGASLAAPVFNRYGCREVGNIAHECTAHGGLHVFEDSHVVEVVDERGGAAPPRQPGRILVTNLTSRATPFIRYDLGDVGRLYRERCSCGRTTALLEVAEGRIGEIVTSPSGKWIHGEFFTHLFYKVRGVRRFQVVQEDPRTLRIVLESDGPVDAETLAFLAETIRRSSDPAFEVRFEQVARIPTSASGKHRFIESRVPLRVSS